MKGSSNFSIIRIRLPRYLVEWLYEFSNQIAMQPDQVIATILTYYYEAWKAGLEKGRRISISESASGVESAALATETVKTDIEELVEDFIRAESIKKNTFIIREFASWVKKKGVPASKIHESLIQVFLEEYQRGHSISKKSYYVYKGLLRKFVEYVWQHTT